MSPNPATTAALTKLPCPPTTRAQQAITLTLFHGAFTVDPDALAYGFGVDALTGRPMTIRAAFYPLFGDIINGLFGDAIDALSIATTTLGVCTPFGLASR